MSTDSAAMRPLGVRNHPADGSKNLASSLLSNKPPQAKLISSQLISMTPEAGESRWKRGILTIAYGKSEALVAA